MELTQEIKKAIDDLVAKAYIRGYTRAKEEKTLEATEMQIRVESFYRANLQLAKFKDKTLKAREDIQELREAYYGSEAGRGIELALEVLDGYKIMSNAEAEARGLDK